MCIRDSFQTDNLSRIFRNGQRKGAVGVFHAVLTVFRRQTKVPVEGVLRVKVDAPMLEAVSYTHLDVYKRQEHTFADTLLHRELGRLFRLEA